MKNLNDLRSRVHTLRQQLAQAEYDLRSAENEGWDEIQKQREQWMRMQQAPAIPSLTQGWPVYGPIRIGDMPGWWLNGPTAIGSCSVAN